MAVTPAMSSIVPEVRGMTRRACEAWNPGEAALVTMKDRKRHRGKLVEASDERVTLTGWGKKVAISKWHVSQVYYLRWNPMTGSALYSAQEMYFIDPQLWPYLLHIAPKIRVLLYDSSMPEDNAPVECKNHPWDRPR